MGYGLLSRSPSFHISEADHIIRKLDLVKVGFIVPLYDKLVSLLARNAHNALCSGTLPLQNPPIIIHFVKNAVVVYPQTPAISLILIAILPVRSQLYVSLCSFMNHRRSPPGGPCCCCPGGGVGIGGNPAGNTPGTPGKGGGNWKFGGRPPGPGGGKGKAGIPGPPGNGGIGKFGGMPRPIGGGIIPCGSGIPGMGGIPKGGGGSPICVSTTEKVGVRVGWIYLREMVVD